MIKFVKRTNMMEEAKHRGRKLSPAVELLIFMAVFMVSYYLQIMILTVVNLFYFFSDKVFLNLAIEMYLSKETDSTEIIERMYQLLLVTPEWIYILGAFLSVLFAVFAIIYCRFIDKRPVSSLGIRKGNIFSECIVGFLVGAVLIAAVAGLGIATGTFKFNGYNGISFTVLIFYLFAFAVQAFAEELLIRGYYMTAITKYAVPVYALVSNGVLFVLLNTMNTYFNLINVINAFLFAIFAGLYVMKRGNIWGVSAFNFAWNFLQMIVFGFNFDGTIETSGFLNISMVKGFDILNGGELGPEAGLFVTLVLFIAIGIMTNVNQNPKEIAVVIKKEDVKNEETV